MGQRRIHSMCSFFANKMPTPCVQSHKPHAWLLTRLNRMADGSRLKEQATSHRSVPDSWVNRKEIFPCLPWPKLSAGLCLAFLSTRLNTGTGDRRWCGPDGFSGGALRCVGSGAGRVPLIAWFAWTHTGLKSSTESALTLHNEWDVDNQQRLSSTCRQECQMKGHMPAARRIQRFIATVGRTSGPIFN